MGLMVLLLFHIAIAQQTTSTSTPQQTTLIFTAQQIISTSTTHPTTSLSTTQQTTSVSTTEQTTSVSTTQQATSVSTTQQATSTSNTRQTTSTTAGISQLTAVPITWNFGGYNIAFYSSNKPDAIMQDNPKFNNLTMAFESRSNTDCQAGSIYGNPNVRDENLGYRSDFGGCMSECVRMNLEMTPYNVGEDPVCTGFVFFGGGSCLVKVGLLESSLCNANNTATAFFLHLF